MRLDVFRHLLTDSTGNTDEPLDSTLVEDIIEEVRSESDVDSLLDQLLDGENTEPGGTADEAAVDFTSDDVLEMLDGAISGNGVLYVGNPFSTGETDAAWVSGAAG